MRVSVTVKPNSHEDKVEMQDDGRLIVSVRAPAKRGKANRVTIKLLSKYLKSKVRIVSGFTKNDKIVEFI